MPVWSRASDKRSHVLPLAADGFESHEKNSFKRELAHESPAPRPVGFRVWLWRALIVNVMVVLVFIFSMALYFPSISTESVVDQALMQGEHTAVPRGPHGFVHLAATTEPDVVPASTTPAIESTTSVPNTSALKRVSELLEPTRTSTVDPDATENAVLVTAMASVSSTNIAILSDDLVASSAPPGVTTAVQDSDEVALPPTLSSAAIEITSVPTTFPVVEIQHSTSVSSIAPTIVENAALSPSSQTTQSPTQLPKNIADLIWALKNKSTRPNAAEQSSTTPEHRAASLSIAPELSTEATRTNSQPSLPMDTRSTEFVTSAEPSVAKAMATESDAPTAATREVSASSLIAVQTPVVTTLSLTPQVSATAVPLSIQSTQEPQQTSRFGDTNIFEWLPPAQLNADDPNRERKVVEWRQSVDEAVQSVRNSVIGGEQLRSLIRQRRDELLALRQELFG